MLTRHALGIHVSNDGAQAVWVSRAPGQAVQCQRVWTGPVLDIRALRREGAWPRRCPLQVVFDAGVDSARLVSLQVALAPGLSWRDRRFQQAAEVLLQHPELNPAICVDEDQQAQVYAIDAQWLKQWREHARHLGGRLHGLGLTHTLDAIHCAHELDVDNPTDWRSQEAQTQAPLAWRAACVALEAQTLRPNWAWTGWQLAQMHVHATYVEPSLAWCRAQWGQSGMNARQMIMAVWVGAMGTVGTMMGLQTFAQWQDDTTQSEARMAQLESQWNDLQRWQADQAAQREADRTREAQRREAWQPLDAHSQVSAQWGQTLLNAQGVWLREWSVQPLAASSESGQPQSILHWQLRAEALSPVHAQTLREGLAALTLWHKPPVERHGQWLHGQEGRFSVWSFELHAQVVRPW